MYNIRIFSIVFSHLWDNTDLFILLLIRYTEIQKYYGVVINNRFNTFVGTPV